MLDVKAIETSYGTSQVLFGMSFSVNEGEMVSLLDDPPAEHDWLDDYLPSEIWVIFTVFIIVMAAMWGSIISEFFAPSMPAWKQRRN